jgi:hypothetical protein
MEQIADASPHPRARITNHLTPYVLVLDLVAELLLMLWLLARGVNGQRWKEQAGAAEERRSHRAIHI